MNKSSPLTHINARGEAHMVDIAHKDNTKRVAIAHGTISGKPETIDAIFHDDLKKGDALATARIAAIMGAKKTPDLIPLCHPVALSHVDIQINRAASTQILVEATAETTGKTGVEMEALTAVCIATLTLYDMAKAIDKNMVIGEIKLIKKSGGKSGDFQRKE